MAGLNLGMCFDDFAIHQVDDADLLEARLVILGASLAASRILADAHAADLPVGDCVQVEAAETPAGFTQLGIDTVPPLLGRGVLLDAAGWRGVDCLPPRTALSADELIACATQQGVEVRAGDVLLVRTGYAALWHDEARYLDAAGVGKSGTLWAAEKQVVAVGALFRTPMRYR